MLSSGAPRRTLQCRTGVSPVFRLKRSDGSGVWGAAALRARPREQARRLSYVSTACLSCDRPVVTERVFASLYIDEANDTINRHAISDRFPLNQIAGSLDHILLPGLAAQLNTYGPVRRRSGG